jgi:hypothetical protein
MFEKKMKILIETIVADIVSIAFNSLWFEQEEGKRSNASNRGRACAHARSFAATLAAWALRTAANTDSS